MKHIAKEMMMDGQTPIRVIMNNRIKELESQCWVPLQYGPAWFNGTKFAELIVRECIDTVLDSSVEYCTRPQIASEIKQHFGVTE
jgi:hypothetical protein